MRTRARPPPLLRSAALVAQAALAAVALALAVLALRAQQEAPARIQPARARQAPARVAALFASCSRPAEMETCLGSNGLWIRLT